jgi:hypothetical protein
LRRIALLLSFFLLIHLSHAQDSWIVWLYDAQSGEIYLVENTGAVQISSVLPVPTAFVSYSLSPNLAVSLDGQRLAYSISGTNAEEQHIDAFTVYDIANDRVNFTFEPPQQAETDSLLFSNIAWNSTGNIVAYAYAWGTSEEEQGWAIKVFNAIDGREISELTNTSPYFENQPIRIAPFLLPVLQVYGEATLGFNLVPYQAYDASIELDNYQWDIVTGRVNRTNRAPRLTGDTWQATGETLSPMLDERINYDANLAPYTNALQVYRPDIAARVTFFASTTYDLLEASFAENGQKIVALAEDMLSFQETRLLINRAGVSRVLPQINPIEDVLLASPTGFVYVIDNATPFLIHLDTRDDSFAQAAIWQAPNESRLVPVWVSPLAAAQSDSTPLVQETYDAWGQLAPPIALIDAVILPETSISAQAVATITPIGSTGGIITVNTVAVTNTTSGDRLNMRSEPSLSGTIIARVDPGTRVVITDGPVAEDGFTWWEIRLPTGQIGWVVERTEGIQTLIPTN